MKNSWVPDTCGVDCSTMPVIATDSCLSVKQLKNIDMIYYSREALANDPKTANPAFATEFAGRLSNSTTTSPAIRFRKVNAELPFASPNTVKDEDGILYLKDAGREVTWKDSNMADGNYNWHETAQCIGEARWWFTIGPHIYGGKNGIVGSFFSVFGNTDNNDAPASQFDCKVSFTERGILPRGIRPL